MNNLRRFCEDVINNDGTLSTKFECLIGRYNTFAPNINTNLHVFLTKKIFELFEEDINSENFDLKYSLNEFLARFFDLYEHFDLNALVEFQLKLEIFAALEEYNKSWFLYKMECPNKSKAMERRRRELAGLLTKLIELNGVVDSGDNELSPGIEQHFPSKPLRILKRFWDSVEDRCFRNNSEFLRIYLDELLVVAKQFPSNFVNLRSEILDVLQCLFGFQLNDIADIRPNDTYDKPNWNVCEQILQLFLPADLENDHYDVQLLTCIIRSFLPIIMEPISEELTTQFDDYVSYQFDPGYKNDYTEWNVHNLNAVLDGLPQVNEDSQCRKELSNHALLILCQQLCQQSSCLEEVIFLLKCIVIFDKNWKCNPTFSRLCKSVIDSMPNKIVNVNGVDLLKHVSQLEYFCMTMIFLQIHDVRAHLELGFLQYSCAVSMKRHVANNSTTPNIGHFNRISENMIKKCKAHFLLASSNKHILPQNKWAAFYFLAKLDEKSNAPLLRILGHYQKCAHLMESSGCRMFNNYDQNLHSKCLEIFYRIYRCLDKERQKAYDAKDNKRLHELIIFAELFLLKNNQQRSNGPSGCFVRDLNDVLSSKMPREIEPHIELLNVNTFNLIKLGYLDIQKRSTHYKTDFRLYEMSLIEDNDISGVAEQLYKRFIQSDRNNMSLLFTEYSAIHEAYFQRYGSADFHVYKVFDFLTDKIFDAFDVEKVFCFLRNIFYAFENEEYEKHRLSRECVKMMIDKCVKRCSAFLKLQIERPNVCDNPGNYIDWFDKLKPKLESYGTNDANELFGQINVYTNLLLGDLDQRYHAASDVVMEEDQERVSNTEQSVAENQDQAERESNTASELLTNESTSQTSSHISSQSPPSVELPSTSQANTRMDQLRDEERKAKMEAQEHHSNFMKSINQYIISKTAVGVEEISQTVTQKDAEIKKLKKQLRECAKLITKNVQLKNDVLEESRQILNKNQELEVKVSELTTENAELKERLRIMEERDQAIQEIEELLLRRRSNVLSDPNEREIKRPRMQDP